MRPLLHPQTDGLAFLRRRDWRGALFMEPGLGKTRLGFEVAKRARRTLVMAPPNPCEFVWPEQHREWASELRFDVVTGAVPAGERYRRLIKDPPDVAVMNYELCHWLYDVVRTKRRLPYDALILDESGAAKNHDSVTFNVLKAIEHVFDAVIPMNGTPAENSLHDVWSQLYLVDRGAALGPRIGVFRERYFMPVVRENYATWKCVRPAELRLAAAPLCFVRRTADCVDMPPLSFRDVRFRLSNAERKAYDRVKDDNVLPRGEPVPLENAGVALDKLRQITSGFVYDEERVARSIGQSKLRALEEVIDEQCGQPLLVAYWYRGSMETICEFTKMDVPTINRHTPSYLKRAILNDWKRGRLPLLLGQVTSVAKGLNMQSPGEAGVCFYDMPWSHGLHWQFIRRIWRLGQIGSVIVRRLIAHGTVDGYVAMKLKKKQKDEDDLMSTILEEELL